MAGPSAASAAREQHSDDGPPRRRSTLQQKASAVFEKGLDCLVDACGYGMYWVGPLFVLTGMVIIAFAMYVGFGILLPAKDTWWSWTWILRGVWGTFLTINVVFNYTVRACVRASVRVYARGQSTFTQQRKQQQQSHRS